LDISLDFDIEIGKMHDGFINLLSLYYFSSKKQKDLKSFIDKCYENSVFTGCSTLPSMRNMLQGYGIYYDWSLILSIDKGTNKKLDHILNPNHYLYIITNIIKSEFREGTLENFSLDELLNRVNSVNDVFEKKSDQIFYYNQIVGNTLLFHRQNYDLGYFLTYICNYSKQASNLTNVSYILSKKKHSQKFIKEVEESLVWLDEKDRQLPFNLELFRKCVQKKYNKIKDDLRKNQLKLKDQLNHFNAFNFFLCKSTPDEVIQKTIEEHLSRFLTLYEIILGSHDQSEYLIDSYLVLTKKQLTSIKSDKSVKDRLTMIKVQNLIDDGIKIKLKSKKNLENVESNSESVISNDIILSELNTYFN
jgi:hypothetical protein